MKKLLLSFLVLGLALTSCKKSEDDDSSSGSGSATAAKSFENITFDQTHAFFSTDGSMSTPVDSTTAKTISSKIDFTYIVNWDYSEDGFLEPKTRSQHWYWDEYYKSWLSNSVETRIYKTTLTKADFDAAKADQSKIGEYFSQASTVLVPHDVFGDGTCIGGRECYNSNTGEYSILLSAGKVFGFKNTASGKRGLLYLRTDQVTFWPDPIVSTETNVDMIREN